MKKIALAGLLAASTALAANGATIKYEGTFEGLNAIAIDGTIVPGDSDKFDAVAARVTGSTVVLLGSPGGIVDDGLNIGLTIRDKGFGTAVPDDTVCASMCGLIWLAGKPRFLTESSKIGFHAASRSNGEESGQGNALVGAYLAKLGLSYRAIAYLTDAAPDDMRWLNPDDAERVGITYSLVKPRFAEPQPFIVRPQTQYHAPLVPPAGSLAEQGATRLVQAYFATWSKSGTDVEALSHYYNDMVSFFGGSVSRDRVMDEKRKFAIRWPIRHYTVNPGSLFVQCDTGGCSVTGVVNWDCTSLERGAHSVGSANYALRIVGGVIVSESGSVLTNHADAAGNQQDGETPSYSQGRQARIEYEQWYGSLPEGGYKDGATFWATHRSDKPAPPNCVGSTDWIAGCVAARVRLVSSDVRRITDRNFWSGWNSL
jgi:hypothetical protein